MPLPLNELTAEPGIILAVLERFVTTAEPALMLPVGLTATTTPNSKFLSSTDTVFELTEVVVPLTVKLPAITVVALLIVRVPVVEPIDIAVPAPAKLTVVAVVLKISIDALPATMLVVIVGLVPKTILVPLPVVVLPSAVTVPLVGSVKLVAPDVTNEIVPLSSVVKLAPSVRLPPSLTVRAALTTSRVNARPAVNVVELVDAMVRSKAAAVSRSPRLAIADNVGPVASATTVPLPDVE